mmetsp:Transcript_10808/g.16606  ORF Transcript_10808/g.16606 Transcript_10808/m.16606 type:complete len:177 (-) Transcript_10808:43-573(-)|eukprot:CAMPEP_0178925260 /NCGR_PEP_ID=MMETSP0786-20121207/17804_1 /TAXON_ID=186022 /ORGANISM="Thalassionema frauenfeldii, Strain CCMP 1798" /LENGTH=176 /DNA_ID=CAMNT_0020600103 /DNA_START=128 /DNA_END=658 /DNA_ORIENTATION=+
MIRSFISRSLRSKRLFSDWGRGQDLLADSLEFGAKPKIILDGYSTSGFDVINLIEKVNPDEESDESGALHVTESMFAFPHSCFIWKMDSIHDITYESLAPAILHRPNLDYVFIGSENPMNPQKLEDLKRRIREKSDIVIEQMDIGNAMGTFNILNGEDRNVAVALILPKVENEIAE